MSDRGDWATCSAPDCDRPTRNRTGLLCAMHQMRMLRNGSLENKGYRSGPGVANWRGDQIGYKPAHARVKRLRGPASAHACEHCGAPATDWAYNHQDPNERTAADGYPYSTRPEFYIPLCKGCHKPFDVATIAAQGRLKTHCINGHEFTPANTRVRARGGRECRACDRERKARRGAA